MMPNRFILIVLLCLSSLRLWAIDEKLTAALRGEAITTASTGMLRLEDQDYGQNTSSIHYQKTSVHALLRLDERSKRKQPDNWRLTVSYSIKLWGANGNQLTHTPAHSLVIDYMKQGPYNDIALNLHEVGNADVRKAQLTITAIKKELLHDDGSVLVSTTMTALSDSVYKDVILELQFHAEKYKTLASGAPAPGHWALDNNGGAIMNPAYVVSDATIVNSGCGSGTIVPGNEVTFYWNTVEGAESYDLEYLFVDAGADPLCTSNYDFEWRDATRINTKWNFHRIPLLFPRGKIVYRVRAVGVNLLTDIPNKIVRGPWSSGTGLSGNTSMNHAFAYGGLSPGINWTASVQYAEEGKSKSILAYFDGMGSPRQTLTYSTTDSLTMAVENTYDHQGRQSMTLLPSFHEYTGLRYLHNLNTGFDRSVYDQDTVFAAASGFSGITPGTATGDFYSDQNNFLNYSGNYYPKMLRRTLAAYQADAEGFPFTHQRISNDGLGRIQAESQPGYAYRLGGGHDTRYFYGAPGSQAELDRLFGNEVGFVANYRKEMAVDPNGQVSVKYLDGYDRVIATALAGTNVGDKLHLLASAYDTPQLSSSALDNNHLNGSNELESSKSLLVAVPNTQYTLTYSADTLLFRDLCLGDNPCAFELSISIIDEEGHHLLDFDNDPNTPEPSWRPFNAATGFAYTKTVTLPEIGKYTLVKRVRLNHTEIANVRHAVGQYLGTDTSNAGSCFVPPSFDSPCKDCETSCEESFRYPYTYNGSTYTVYHTDSAGLAGLTTDTILAAATSEGLTALFALISQPEADSIEALITECRSYCNNTPTLDMGTECDLLLGALKRDLVPGGQYFDNRPKSPTVDTTNTYALYVGSAASNPASINHWLYNYGNAFNVTFGNLIGITGADWDTLRIRWADVQAAPGFEAVMEQFVELHPEYCLWKARCGNRDDSCACNRPGAQLVYHSINQYENALYATLDDSTARETMLFLPMGVPLSAPLNVFNPTQLSAQELESGYCYTDPLIAECNDPQGTYANQVINYLFNYLVAGTETLSVWEVLADPDGIHLLDTATYSGPIPQGLITYMQVLHGNGTTPGSLAPFGQVPSPGQLSMFTFFRSAYEAIRLQIKQLRGTDAFAGCAPADHPLLYFVNHASSAPGALQAAATKLPYLNALDSDDDGYIDTDLNPYSYATAPGMDLSGFQVRIPYINLQIPPTYAGLSADFCTQVVMNLPALWITELENSLNGCVLLDVSNADTLQTLPYLIPQAEKGILKDYFQILIADACSTYTASLITASPQPAIFNAGNAPVSVYNSLPWGSPATNTAQGIVDIYMAQTGTVGCPPVGRHFSFNDTAAMNHRQALACDCGRLRDVIYAAGGLKTPYQQINPFQYTLFSVPASDIFDTAGLLNYLAGMGNYLLAPYDSATLHTGGAALLMNWINVCSGNSAPDTTLIQQGAFMQGLRCVASQIPLLNDCGQEYLQYYRSLKNQAFMAFRDSQLQRFNNLYEPRCLQRLLNEQIETFTISYGLNEYHYTLYFYDRAGNLVKTVPPMGVVPIDNTVELTRIHAFRKANSHKKDYATLTDPNLGTFVRPGHFKATNFQHDTHEKVIRELSPDGGETYFYYDFLGRPQITRNARQLADGTTTYLLFDNIGRVKEVGEWLKNIDSIQIGQYTDFREMVRALPNDSLSGMSPILFLLDQDHNRRQISRTYYDRSYFSEWNFSIVPLAQRNLRNRVSSIAYYEEYPANWRYFDNASHYSYDTHGALETFIQDVPPLQPFGKRFLRTDYEYDLVSSNVKAVHFMRNNPENFSHYYRYNSDNRMVRIYSSSTNGILKELEAKYYYHIISNLARIEFGRKQVQGLDYVHTLQGRIKAINSDVLNPINDRGKDGLATNNLHESFGVDGFGYSVTYHDNDYKAIGNTGAYFKPVEMPMPASSLANSLIHVSPPSNPGEFGLFNGNIVKMVSNTLGCDSKPMDVLGRFYQFDQLNRLRYSNSLTSSNNGAWSAENSTDWSTLSNPNEIFRTATNYDADGNITGLSRTDKFNVAMDALQYHYAPGGTNNALLYVSDGITGNTHTADLKDQTQGNYQYDPIGNLTLDLQNDSSRIGWNLFRKVQKVNFNNRPDLWYAYNPLGRKILKRVDASGQNGAQLSIYALDAEGNTLAMYHIQENKNAGTFKLECNQRNIYAAKRLGTQNQRIVFGQQSGFQIQELENSIYQHFDPQELSSPPVWQQPSKVVVTLGQKQYELTNHLSNVISTVSDRKVFDTDLDSDNSNILKRYRPEVRLAAEYYPFGSLLPDWGCRQSVQCSTYVITQTNEVTLSNFVNNVQKSGQTVTTPDCSGSRGNPQCVKVEMPHKGDLAWINFNPGQTGTQQLSTRIYFLSETYGHSLQVALLQLDSAGTKIVDTVFVSQVENTGDTITHAIEFFNSDSNNIYRIVYEQKSTGQTVFRWLNAKLFRVTQTYVTDCGSQTLVDGSYTYGFNGVEKENEIWGIDGSAYTFEFRIHDARLGRFLSVDPLAKRYPWNSVYAFAENDVISCKDLEGAERDYAPLKPGNEVNAHLRRTENAKVEVEYVQAFLDIVGLIPVLGEVADGTNGVIYIFRGQYGNASLSFAAMIPYAGWAATGAKLTNKFLRITLKKGDEVIEYSVALKHLMTKAEGYYAHLDKTRKMLAKNMEKAGMKVIGQAHHILPLELVKKNKYIEKLYEEGWDFHKVSNGIDLPKGFHGNHPAYTTWIDNYVNQYVEKFGEKNLKQHLEEKLTPALRNKINEGLEIWKKDQNQNLNDIFKELNKTVEN